jgi:dipeptidyl aminopeptidase/acylaminoacyl peptidase
MRNRIIRVVLLAVTTVGASALGWCQVGTASATPMPKRAMTFEDLERMKRVSDPQISPSGKWVMFSATEADLNSNSMVNHLWVVPLIGTTAATVSGSREHQITSGSDGEFEGRFSPDGKMVLFIGNDPQTSRSQIFVAPWDDTAGKPGTPKRLTNLATEADGAVWSPDSQRILFTSRVYPECSDEATWAAEDVCDKAKDEAADTNFNKEKDRDHPPYRTGDHHPGPKRSHMLVVFAANGNAIRDLTPRRSIGDAEMLSPLGAPTGYAWAPDSMEAAFVANLDRSPQATTNNAVFVLRLNDAAARPERVSVSLASNDAPAYSPDGKWLAFRSQARPGHKNDEFRLMLLDRRSGTISEALSNFDRRIDEFTWTSDSASIFFATRDRGKSQIYSAAVADENTIHYVAMPTGYLTLLVSQANSESGSLQISSDGMWLVSTSMRSERPPEIFRTSLRIFADDAPEVRQQKIGLKLALAADKANPPVDRAVPVAPEALTHLNDNLLETLSIQKMQSFWFATGDNTKVQGFLIPPPGFDPSRKYPVKFLIHEASQGVWGDAWSYRWNSQLMAASGYVVLMVNPRGSTGYGQAFVEALNGESDEKVYSDLMKGLDYAEQHYSYIDKARECTLGTGLGAYVADWILTHTNRFACIVTHDGMFNPENTSGVTDSPDPKRMQQWSRMPSIQNARTPTLVIHSQRGNRSGVSESPQLYTALQRLNVQSRIVNLPDDGHLEDQPQNARLWYESVGDWCDKWTKTNRYAPGVPQPTEIAKVPDPTKPQTVRAPSQAVASIASETAKTQLPPTKPATTKSASSMPPVQSALAPVPPAPTHVAVAPPDPAVQSSAHPSPIPETSTPSPAPGLTIVPNTKPTPQAANSTISQTPPTVLPSTTPTPLSSPRPQLPAVPPPLSPQSISQGSFAISISALANKLQIGEDARVMITLTNVSDHPILFAHRPGKENPEFSFIFLVRNAAGRLMGENIANSSGASDSRTVDQVPPGGTVVQTAHLSKLVHLSQPGQYTVRVYRKDADNNLVVQSNEVTLNIVSSLPAQ